MKPQRTPLLFADKSPKLAAHLNINERIFKDHNGNYLLSFGENTGAQSFFHLENAAPGTPLRLSAGSLTEADCGLHIWPLGSGALGLGYQASPTGHQAIGIGYLANTPGLYAIGIGYQCSPGGSYSVGMGYQCSPEGSYSAGIGRGSNPTNQYGVGIGRLCSPTGQSAVGVGRSCSPSGNNSIGIGYNCSPSGESAVAMGLDSKPSLPFQTCFAGGSFDTVGDCQYSRLLLRGTTTDATPTEAVLPTRFILSDEKTYSCKVITTARQDTGGISFCSEDRLIIERTGGTVALVGSVSNLAVITNDAALAVALTADDINKSLKIEMTGKDATNLRWSAAVTAVELAYED